ncbi:MAG TPA: protein kinase, partial [Gemmatimonadales bacterium]|nr:protein kinase [Gemmatimonadales bacterium]
MSATEAVNILRDVARALAYAHGRGIVHRDIKPDNVLLSAGSATVTDFGIAKALNAARTAGEAGNETLTQVGTAIGTPTYMAPEQALGDPDTNHRADIYAFGVMAYEMLAGRPPFQGSNSSKVLAAHLGETAFPLLQLAPDTPPALAELVMQCLAKDPDQRPQEASQLVRVLETVTTSGSGAAIPSALRGAPLPLGKAVLLWLVATATVVVTAWAATRVVGLPDWVLPGAIGVMLAGLPVIAATAYVQRTTRRAFSRTPGSPTPTQGTMATLALKASPHLSWKRAWTGGAIAVGGFAVLVIGFMVLRAIGIGPMGSLKAKGVFGDHEMLVVADFRAPASDSMLGMTVAEALRTDLAQSRALDVMTRAALRDQLVMMRRSGESRIPYDVAREIAQRAGAKAVLDGEVTQLGQGYVLSASLVGTLDGQQLATFRETVSGLINAIGKLGKAVRERAGESLRTIQATRELERVTTSSLPALRKYVEGNRVASEDAQEEQGLRLIQEAVQIDSTFAMAWRKIAVLMGNLGLPREQQLTAITKAFQFRHNLTDDERYLTEGSYYTSGPEPDLQKGLAAYDQAILLDSANGAALNNSAMILQEQARWDEAERRARLATRVPRAFSAAFINLLVSQLHGRSSSESLDSTIALMQERLPGSAYKVWLAGMAEWGKGDVGSAWHMFRMAYDSASNTHVRSNTARSLEGLAAMQGKFRERWNWAGRGDEAAARLRSPAVVRLDRMIDSAFSTLMVVGDTQGAHAILAAALRSVPPASLPVAERPWQAIAGMAARTGDAALVKEAQAAWEREQSRSDPLAVSIRQGFLVHLAIAEQ